MTDRIGEPMPDVSFGLVVLFVRWMMRIARRNEQRNIEAEARAKAEQKQE